ncbi:MAG: hypothetical protein LCH54_01650 [Bacteroidetes bacterium]|nr:hypothetical protein [Bacteroidota bacterium]
MLALLFFLFTTLNQPEQDLEIRLGIDDTIKTRWPQSFLSIKNISTEEIKILSEKWEVGNVEGAKEENKSQFASLDENNKVVDYRLLKVNQEYYYSMNLFRMFPRTFRLNEEAFLRPFSPLKEGKYTIVLQIKYSKNDIEEVMSTNLSFVVKYSKAKTELIATEEYRELVSLIQQNQINWTTFLSSNSKVINSFLLKNKNTDAANFLAISLARVLSDIPDSELLCTLQDYYDLEIHNHPAMFIEYFRYYFQNKDNPALSTVIGRFDKLVENNKEKIFNRNDFNFTREKGKMNPDAFEVLKSLVKD